MPGDLCSLWGAGALMAAWLGRHGGPSAGSKCVCVGGGGGYRRGQGGQGPAHASGHFKEIGLYRAQVGAFGGFG